MEPLSAALYLDVFYASAAMSVFEPDVVLAAILASLPENDRMNYKTKWLESVRAPGSELPVAFSHNESACAVRSRLRQRNGRGADPARTGWRGNYSGKRISSNT